MANQWLRLWQEMPNNPKWRTIAHLSKQPIANVMAVYLHLLVSASLSPNGKCIDMTADDLSSALDIGVNQIKAILKAMEDKVIRNGYLINNGEHS